MPNNQQGELRYRLPVMFEAIDLNVSGEIR